MGWAPDGTHNEPEAASRPTDDARTAHHRRRLQQPDDAALDLSPRKVLAYGELPMHRTGRTGSVCEALHSWRVSNATKKFGIHKFFAKEKEGEDAACNARPRIEHRFSSQTGVPPSRTQISCRLFSEILSETTAPYSETTAPYIENRNSQAKVDKDSGKIFEIVQYQWEERGRKKSAGIQRAGV